MKKILLHIGAFFCAVVTLLCFMVGIIHIAGNYMARTINSKDIVMIPNIVGKQLIEAKELINQAHLNFSILDYEHHEFTEGKIVTQIPASGRSIYRDRTISVIVSKGPKLLFVPALVGLSFSSLDDVLRSYELKTGDVIQHYSQDVPAGYIIETSPKAGSSIMAGRAVNVVISIGRDPLEIDQSAIEEYYFFDEELF